MGDVFSLLQGIVGLALSVGALALAVFALVDAVRQRPDAYPATNNQTKTMWLVLLGVAVALAVVSIPGFGFLNIISVALAAVYLTKVRPPIREITGRSGGPYGGY